MAGTGTPLNVAVTIKPVHSLVAGLMQGIGEPVLIMKSSASLHHYALKPSERRALEDATLVVWVGPELENFMTAVLKTAVNTRHIALMELEGILRLPLRTMQHEHDEHARNDPHIWLSVHTAHVIVDAVAKQLIAADPDNINRYETNRGLLHQRIEATDAYLRRLLHGKTAPFLTYHDAYQYFEAGYQLNNAGFVSANAELTPSAKHVQQLRTTIKEQNITCLFYEAPVRPALVNMLAQHQAINTVALDAIGIYVSPGPDAWFEIMQRLANAFNSCL